MKCCIFFHSLLSVSNPSQVLNEARLTQPYVDTYYHKHDDTLLVVFHNPVGKQLHNRSIWNVRLHSNVGFRNYLDHVSNMIGDWNTQQILLEAEMNRTPTPVPVLPEPPVVQIKVRLCLPIYRPITGGLIIGGLIIGGIIIGGLITEGLITRDS